MNNFEIFYKDLQDQRIRKLKRHSAYEEILEFLAQHHDVTLRDLKQNLSFSKLERFLDDLIALDFVVRKDRRYTIQLENEREGQENKTKQEELANLLQPLSKERATQILFHYLKEHPFSVETPLLTQKDSTLSKKMKEIPFISINSASNSPLKFNEIQLQNTFSLSTFFEKMSLNAPLNKKEKALYDFVQDVSTEYAYQQFGFWLLKGQDTGSFETKREDIFLKALVEMGFLTQQNSMYTLNIPFIEEVEDAQVLADVIGENPTIDDYLLLKEVFSPQVHPLFLTLSR